MWLEGREAEGLLSEARDEGHSVSVVRTPSQKCVRNRAYRILFHPLHVPGEKTRQTTLLSFQILRFCVFPYIYLLKKNAPLIDATRDTPHTERL